MERLAWAGGSGVWPIRHEWDWLWATLAFCPSFDCYRPDDRSGWTHPLNLVPTNGAGVPSLGWNAFGPAAYCPNSPSIDDSKGWVWYPNENSGIKTGSASNHKWWNWTLALGWRRGIYVDFPQWLAHIYSAAQRDWAIRLVNDGRIQWIDQDGGRILNSPTGTANFDGYGPSQTLVVTTRDGIDTVMYCNGREVASAAYGDAMYRWNLNYLGADLAKKENVCLNGYFGPYILSRHAWSPEEVAQWAEDPYGFLRPDFWPPGWGWPRIPSATPGGGGRIAATLGIVPRISSAIGAGGRVEAELSAMGRIDADSSADGRVEAVAGATGRIGAVTDGGGRISARILVNGRECSMACPIALNWKANNDLKLSDVTDTRDDSPITDAATVEVAIWNIDADPEVELTGISPLTLSQLPPPDQNDFRGDVLVTQGNGFSPGMRLRLEYSYDAGLGKVAFFAGLAVVQIATG